MADDLTPHVPILQPGSLMCVCGRRDNDASAHPFGLVAAATQEAGVEDHAEALWHTLWFHTLGVHATHRDFVSAGDPDAEMFDDDEDREAYNAYQSERDIDAEVERHRRTVAACRDAYRRWGVDLPDDDTVIAHPTYASWRTSPTEEVPHGDR